jgi:hypothetical protein
MSGYDTAPVRIWTRAAMELSSLNMLRTGFGTVLAIITGGRKPVIAMSRKGKACSGTI